MKVVDAFTGTQFEVDGKIPTMFDEKNAPVFRSHEGGLNMVMAVEPGYWKGRILLRHTVRGILVKEQWVPLDIRWTHPHFFLQHVGFIPT